MPIIRMIYSVETFEPLRIRDLCAHVCAFVWGVCVGWRACVWESGWCFLFCFEHCKDWRISIGSCLSYGMPMVGFMKISYLFSIVLCNDISVDCKFMVLNYGCSSREIFASWSLANVNLNDFA